MSGHITLTYQQRLESLRSIKLEQTREKQRLKGAMDMDDQGQVLPPMDQAEMIEIISGSGVKVKEFVLKDFRAQTDHPSGGIFGPKSCGVNFKALLDVHPTYIQPLNSMAGVYRVYFISHRDPAWNPEFDCLPITKRLEQYGVIDHGIGGVQHFCPDLTIGLELGWEGLKNKVQHYHKLNPDKSDFYDGLEAILTGVQHWIQRHSDDARRMAEEEEHPQLIENLLTIADICERLVYLPPNSFREACQWLVFFQAVAKMYNGSGEWGQLDELLRPYYEKDMRRGVLTDEEAVFHIACLLLSETAYIQLGGPDAQGNDLTSHVSFLILEAIHQLKIPANIALRVSDDMNPDLFRRGLEILCEDKMGFPKFIGDKPLIEGCLKSGFTVDEARRRIYAGCHWMAVPGREYGLMDMIKLDFAWLFDRALKEMMADNSIAPSVEELWNRFEKLIRGAVVAIALGIDFHMEHMHQVFPELFLDLFCHGPVEKGEDISHGGVDIYKIGVDGASLATVADSFAAIEQRVEKDSRLTWEELMNHIESDWQGKEGEQARRLMKTIPRFGRGGSSADEWAVRISKTFSRIVIEKKTPNGFSMIPGLFSWARVIDYGKRLGATPDGRKAGEPVSHGPNPAPGFNCGKPGTPTQLSTAVASVQPGYGNSAPLQLDLDPSIAEDDEGIEKTGALIRAHFDLGGTMININVMNKKQILEAYEEPSRYPDLIVRVTGFSAYFASLSDEMRKYIVDRLV